MYTRSTISMDEYGWSAGDAGRRDDKLSARTRRRQQAMRTERQCEIRRRKRRQKSRFGLRKRTLVLLLAVVLLGVMTWTGHTPVSRMLLAGGGCPKSLMELAERQPEAYTFVRDYSKHKGEAFDAGAIDISDDLAEEEVPSFLQWDERWGYAWYGDDYLAVNGCGPVCLSMVACARTGDASLNPLAVAQFAEQHGYYVNGKGSAWALMEEGAAQLGLSAYVEYPSGDTIQAALAEGKTIICSVMPGDFTSSGHFIVLAGLADDGSVIVHDPNSIKRSEKTWDAQQIADQTAQMWVYD